MSKIEEVLKRLNLGHQIIAVPLNVYFDMLSGMSGVALKWQETGNCKFIDYMNVYMHRRVDVTALHNATVKSQNQTILQKGDVLFTAASEVPDECAIAGEIEEDFGERVFLDDHLFCLRLKKEARDKICKGYLKYAFNAFGFRSQVKKTVRGVTRFYVAKEDFMKLHLFLPPRPVQDEIVKALDALDAAVKALEEERAARQEQFEAVREKLVNAGGKVELGTVAHYSQERVATSQIAKGNYVNVELLLPNKMGRAERSLVPHESNCVRFKSGDVLIGNIRPYLKKIWLADVNGGTNGDVLVVTPNDDGKLNSKYLFYALSQDDFFTYASCKVKAGKMPRGDKASMLRYAISMPDVSTQQKIAAQLDAFAAVVAALDEEIAARREQFAGWLERLMTFDAREVAVA